MADYSEAIERGVSNWLDANRANVNEIIRKTVADCMSDIVDRMAYGSMQAIGKFLNENSDDLKTGIAMAIATSWAARQHPVPKAKVTE
jgi:hypothetical protein